MWTVRFLVCVFVCWIKGLGECSAILIFHIKSVGGGGVATIVATRVMRVLQQFFMLRKEICGANFHFWHL